MQNKKELKSRKMSRRCDFFCNLLEAWGYYDTAKAVSRYYTQKIDTLWKEPYRV